METAEPEKGVPYAVSRSSEEIRAFSDGTVRVQALAGGHRTGPDATLPEQLFMGGKTLATHFPDYKIATEADMSPTEEVKRPRPSDSRERALAPLGGRTLGIIWFRGVSAQ